jgi:radical SAM superfamily enzyme YgiQ (UPF0313 family)
MRILLVVPPSRMEERYGTLRDAGALYPSLGLAFLAAGARRAGHQTMLFDAEAEEADLPAIRRRLLEFRPHLVGMQTFCANLSRCREVARLVKATLPECKVVLGGVQVTMFPEEGLREPAVDFVIRGEGDRSFLALIDALEGRGALADVGGLVYRNGAELAHNPPARLIANMDELPLPALDLFPIPLYHSSSQLRGKRTLHMFTSRGCPYDCAYCSGDLIFGSTFRYYSASRVIQEMRWFRDELGADGIQFYDETFTVHRERVVELCRALIEENLRMPWTCFTRVDLVDEELLRLMHRAGCYQIFFGVETGVPRLLKMIRKRTTLDQARHAFRLTRKIGIETVASFMLTLPTETVEETWESIRFGLELDPDYVYWLTFTPYPGTELSRLAEETGTIVHRDYERYNVFNEIVYVPEGRSEEEIRATVAAAYRKFYFRPRYLARRIRGLRHLPPEKLWNLARGALRTFLRPRV